MVSFSPVRCLALAFAAAVPPLSLAFAPTAAFSPALLNPAFLSIAVIKSSRPIALRAAADPAYIAKLVDEGMSEADAIQCMEKGMTVPQALRKLDAAFERRMATGDSENFFKSFVDVEGDYTDEGWVDESAPSQLFGGFFGGLFGGAQDIATASAPEGGGKSSYAGEWKEIMDPASGSLYFWNEKTGKTTWDKPVGMK